MIRLKSGTEIGYDENFEVFFQKLLSSIIAESMQAVRKSHNIDVDQSEFNKFLAKEIMDNSIFVSHQIFEIGKINQNLAKFLVTGFLFNSIILSIPNLSDTLDGENTPDGSGIIH